MRELINKKEMKYWTNLLKDYDEITSFNIKKNNHINNEYQTESFIIPEDLSVRLNKISNNSELPLYVFLVTILGILISKYNTNKVCIVSPTYKKEENKNAVIFPMEIDDNISFKQLVVNTKNIVIESYKRENCPIDNIIHSLEKENIIDITDVGCALSNIHKVDDLKELGLTLIFCFSKENNLTKCNIHYNINDKTLVRNLFNQFLSCLRNILINMDVKLRDVEIINEDEKNIIINKFNDTKVDYPKDMSVKELFENTVKEFSKNIAIISNGKNLTYEELNNKSNQLAHLLADNGVTKGSLIPVLCDKSMETIIAIIAIIKNGAAYVPINEDYPQSRVQYMIEDCGSNLIIGRRETLNKFDFKEITPIILDFESYDLLNQPTENISTGNINSDDLIYIIYTSGSTGNPKGVCVENKSVVRLVKNQNYIDLKLDDKILQTGSIAFDASTFEIWGALLNGLTVHIESKELILNPKMLKQYIQKNNITTMFMSTALFHQICNVDASTFDDIKSLMIGGDALDSNQVNKLRINNKSTIIINGYGPTENTTFSTYFSIDPLNMWDKKIPIPIGKPISNSTTYVMDKNLRLLPVGVPGELCVGGDGVARGYLNKEELTKEKFVQNPYIKDEIIYRTGDLVKWLPDGNIEFLGRIDNQIKIRGFRLELGEIEREILKHEQVKEAAVIVRFDKNKEKYLCGYIVGKVSQDEIKKFLKKTLPEYMIPPYILTLETLPLTNNGKVDKKLLPEPNLNEKTNKYVAPSNDVEKKMALVWSEVLGAEKIGIKDNFYDFGGDSIKSIQIVSRLKNLGLKVDIKDILDHQTIEKISKYAKTEEIQISQDEVVGISMLTPVMKKFLQEDKEVMKHFNQSTLIYCKEKLEIDKVKLLLKEIVIHHDALRINLNYGEEISLYNKKIDENLFNFKFFDLSHEDNFKEQIAKEGQLLKESIDLEHGPLMNVGLFSTNKGDYLLFVIHHIVVDGVSWRIILEDFYNGYKSLLQGKEIKFPKKTTSFKEWTEKQIEYANGNALLNELDYWSNLADTHLDELPKFNKADKILIKDMISKNIIIDKEATQKLVMETNRAYNTEINDILLSALGITIKDWCGAKNAAITLEGHGREDIINDVDITRTVGWFTSCYPVILDMSDNDISTIIKRNKEVLRKIPNKGIGYGILKYLTSSKNRKNRDMTIETDISFNYLGQIDSNSNNELFTYSNLSTGSDISNNFELKDSIQINSLIQEGNLKFNIDFCKLEYKEDEIEKFVEIFNKNIYGIIEHCSTRKEAELTPTDYGINEYSLEDVEELKQFIKNNIDKDINISKINKLTPMQQGMLFTYMQNKETTAYVIQLELNIKGNLKIESLNKAYNMLAKKYDILKTIIYSNSKHPSQVVLENRNFKIYYEDFTKSCNKEKDYSVFSTELVKKGFDLSKDILFKLSIIKMDDNSSRLIFTIHHIIIDGWSTNILIGDLFKFYEDIERGEKLNIENNINFHEYIKWLYKQRKEDGLAYWKNYLDGYNQIVELPKTKSKSTKYKQKNLMWDFGKEVTRKLEGISSQCGVTLNSICQLAWGILLQRYNRTDDVVFGSVVSGRPPEINGIEEMVGIFINAVPVRITDNGKITVKEMLKEVYEKANQSRNFEYLSLAEIQDQSELKQNLIQNLTVFENFPFNELDNCNNGIKIDFIQGREETNYDFNLSFVLEDSLKLKVMYNENVYTTYLIEKITNQLAKIFKEITNNIDQLVSNVDIVTPEDKNIILNEFNNTKVDYPSNKTIQELFQEQVERTPNNIALVFDDKELSYKELNEKSNALAITLREKGVIPETIVGIMIDRSMEMIIGIIAILKAGGAYLPIDTELPSDRINNMLIDSNANILLTQSSLMNKVDFEGEIIDITKESAYSNDCRNIKNITKSNNLAYVIYTSGTTGKPKGTLIEHRSILNTLLWRCSYHNFNKNDAVLQIMAYCFDGSVGDIFTALISGAKLILISKNNLLNVKYLKEIMLKEKVTSLLISPAFYGTLLGTGLEGITALKKVTVAGESLQKKVLKEHFNRFPDIKLVNEYGPTENSICATVYKINSASENVSIGKPINNTRIYILGKNGQVQPIGAPGELCISGSGLARGYLNNEKITNERFVDNLYEPGERMYRTGDLARWLPDGNIEFLGRIDHQVKIRGFRIELEEIESNLLKMDGITQSVATVIEEENNKYICAYFVSNKDYNPKKLREYLKNRIPSYMMPTYFVRIDKISLTVNGKVDKKNLPMPQEENGIRAKYQPPTTNTEKEIVEVWEKALEINKIGLHDNFFDIGGQSLKAINIVSQLKNLDYDININDLFTNQTVFELACTLEQRDKDKAININNNIEVEKLLMETFGIESKLETKILNNKQLSILYVNNLESNSCKEILKLLSSSVTNDIFPNYILDGSKENEFLISKNQDYKLLLCNLVDKFKSSFSNVETEKCELTAIQRLNITTTISTPSLCAIGFDNYIDIDVLKKAIIYTIRTFDNLRSILSKEGDHIFWRKIVNDECINNLFIPYIDLSEEDVNKQDAIVKDLFYESFTQEYDYNNVLYRILIIKKNLKDYIVYIPINHCIFDGTSNLILQSTIKEYYNKLINCQEINLKKVKPYSEYSKQITKGPVNSTEEEIINTYKLESYCSYSKEIEEKLSEVSKRCGFVKAKLPIPKDYQDIFKNNSWEIACKIIQEFFMHYINATKIPLQVISYGRLYEDKKFNDVFGECIDRIPIIIDKEQINTITYKYCENLLEYASKHNINFLTLLNDYKLSNEYKKIGELLNTFSDDRENYNIILNFLGNMDIDHVETKNYISDLMQNFNTNKINRNTIGFTINYSSDYLYLTCFTFLFEESERIQEFLQNSLDHILKNEY
ncbi:non-ribosomal peptide synthetase [Clostridium cibarium]|uniref:Amino acid adenylation domain-containing protein n=1 Tax=Clostridium cibarium TaxID=2762247 RepID=A0ABR8PTS7_9CLOT|nr:non-ribosomal peptide synthetase [Clostridium cibarium]MBD7911567.1 amino acid adenylation domain-containing protein [Clostridium cibarium]